MMNDNGIPTIVETPPASEPNLTSLLAGIVGDLQALVAQQMRLTQQEIASNLRRRKTVAVILASSVMTAFLASLMLSQSAVHALHRATAPIGIDPARLSMGACYALVGLVWLSLSGGLMVLGRQMLRAIPPWQNLADELFSEKAPWTNDRK